jgi:hypothetical protein
MESVRPASLRTTILDQIGAFLFREGFENHPFTAEGIFEIINLIADYQEEGKVLFPEVIITNELDLLKTIPDYKVEIGSYTLEREAFRKIVKDCAPLCTREWVIYGEIKDGRLRYGITCAELTETTPSLYNQTVGDLKLDLTGCTVAYIHNIGKKTVELKGLRSSVVVSLSLADPEEISLNEVGSLARHICYSLDGPMQAIAKNYFEKILAEGFKGGHGNLIGVVEDKPQAIERLKAILPDGLYLPNPIDLIEILQTFEADKSAINSVALRQHAAVIKSMCNNDGIAIFTTTGKLIGYHIIILGDFLKPEIKTSITGGARSLAFYNLKHCGVFVFGFMKSQDGPVKTFSTYE